MGVTMQGLRPAWPDAVWPELCALGRRCLERQPGARPTFRQLDDQLVALEVLVRVRVLRNLHGSWLEAHCK